MAQQSAFPDVMNLQWSGIIVMMTIIGGGLISFWGPIIGTIFYFLTRDLLGAYTPTWMLWFGLIFMLIIIFQPEGIVGLWRKIRLGKRLAAPEPVLPLGGKSSPSGQSVDGSL
jgi:branched-chain amino acid transport system permease protein